MNNESLNLTKKIVSILDKKKADDIQVLEVGELTILADYFILCTGHSNTQVNALVDAVDEELSKEGIQPHHIEGMRGGLWVLMDYTNVIVHVMYSDTRQFYNVERLWSDAKRLDISDIQK